MKKLKTLKMELHHIITLISALGMLGSFIWALFDDKRKAGQIALFGTCFVGLLAGLGMQEGIIPKPCKKLEVELEPEEEEIEEETEDCDFCDTTVIEIED